jgi:small subunit ribosomal protein S5
MAGLESLRTPDEVAELRGLSVNRVLGLGPDPVAQASEAAPASTNGHADAAAPEQGFELADAPSDPAPAESPGGESA